MTKSWTSGKRSEPGVEGADLIALEDLFVDVVEVSAQRVPVRS